MLTAWHAMASNTSFGWSSRKFLGRNFVKFINRQGRRKSSSFSLIGLGFHILFLFPFFLWGLLCFPQYWWECDSFWMNWLSPFLISHNYLSFAILYDKLFLVLGVCHHDLLLKLNNYIFKNPRLNQNFPLIIKQCWWQDTWTQLDCKMIHLSYFVNI